MASAMRPKALFLSHGGGPCFFMKDTSEKLNSDSPAAKWYRTFTKAWPKPSAIVIVSAHWEGKSTVLVTIGAKHPLLYDYYGFPPHTYELGYDCPGQPALAGRILELLREAGIPAGEESSRGYDHGVFIPLKLMYPDADIPVVQVSLLANLDEEKHLKLGEALKPLLRDEDVMVVGSGQATHNFTAFSNSYTRRKSMPKEVEFEAWLKETTTAPDLSPEERRQRLLKWESLAPHGRVAHPREEHLLPLHVVSACTGFHPGKVIYDEFVAGEMSLASVAFWFPHGAAAEVKSEE